jgi:hypothetical protein
MLQELGEEAEVKYSTIQGALDHVYTSSLGEFDTDTYW